MNERERLLEKRVVDQHVNVAERRSLGIVTREEASEVLKSLGARDGAFPLHHGGKAVYESHRYERSFGMADYMGACLSVGSVYDRGTAGRGVYLDRCCSRCTHR
jgi:hypothetical protein